MSKHLSSTAPMSAPDVSWRKIIRQKMAPVLWRFFARETLVEGRLKGTDALLKCLFIGNSTFCEELRARTYEGQPRVLRTSRMWIPMMRTRLSNQLNDVDLCVAVLPKSHETAFQGLYDYKCPEAVQQIIDVTGSWDEVRSRFSPSKRNVANKFLANKYGLVHRMSNEPADFDFFYHRMFVPHIKKRFGALAAVDTYDDMKEFFLKGQLLLVTKGEHTVTGALALIENGVLTFRRTGVLDGDESNIEGGAQQALYYFQLRYANEHRLRAVDTMLSSPFLNDGVYVNKREWGAAVFPDTQSQNWVYLFNARPSEKIARFFEINPVITQPDGQLKGILGMAHPTDLSTASVNSVTRRYQAKGLEGFTIVTATDTLNVA